LDAQQPGERQNAVAIQRRDGAGKLVGMPPSLHGQGFLDQPDGVAAAYAQPKIVVFTGWQGFIEKPDFLKQ